MANIQVAELNTVSLTSLDTRELAYVVGGRHPWGNFFNYSSTKLDATKIEKSYINQAGNNNSMILQGGYSLANVATVYQTVGNVVA